MIAKKKKAVPSYWFVAIDVAKKDADLTSAELFDLGAEGVEERDEGTLVRGAAGKATLVASFPTKALAALAQKKLGKRARLEELVGDAWRDAWKEHFRPFRLCEGIWVRPPWEAHEARRGEKVLVLEPGRAFGTGLHETTRLVAEAIAMQKRALARVTVLDVGTGSGILALVAIALGAKSAYGIDTDPDAIAVAKENAARNAMSELAKFDATPLSKVRAKYELVLANIEADVLIGLQKQLRARLAFGGRLVLSGILSSRESEVRAAFGKPLSRASIGEWVALTYAS